VPLVGDSDEHVGLNPDDLAVVVGELHRRIGRVDRDREFISLSDLPWHETFDVRVNLNRFGRLPGSRADSGVFGSACGGLGVAAARRAGAERSQGKARSHGSNATCQQRPSLLRLARVASLICS
jgi:hypothetical protein